MVFNLKNIQAKESEEKKVFSVKLERQFMDYLEKNNISKVNLVREAIKHIQQQEREIKTR